MSAPATWTAERNTALKTLLEAPERWSAEDVASMISKQFGFRISRNSVIGKAARLGIPLNNNRGGLPPKPKTERKPRTTPDQRPDIAIRKIAAGPKLAAKPFIPRVVDVRTENVTLLELAPDGCRWPSGEGPSILFCNRRCALPYCGPHHELSVGSGTHSERRTRFYDVKANL